MGAASTPRKEGLFLICSKVPHGLTVIRPHDGERGRTHLPTRPAQTCEVPGRKRAVRDVKPGGGEG